VDADFSNGLSVSHKYRSVSARKQHWKFPMSFVAAPKPKRRREVVRDAMVEKTGCGAQQQEYKKSRRNECLQNAVDALQLLHSDCIKIANDSLLKDRRTLFSDLEFEKGSLEESTCLTNEIERWVDLTTLQSADVFGIDLKGSGKRTLLNSSGPSCRSKSFAK
jgi:hypothetical protein